MEIRQIAAGNESITRAHRSEKITGDSMQEDFYAAAPVPARHQEMLEKAKRLKSLSPGISALVLGNQKNIDIDSVVTARHFSQQWKGRRSGFPLKTVYGPAQGQYYSGKTGSNNLDTEWGKKYLTASDKNGKELWTFKSASMTADPALDSQGNIYFRTLDTLYAVAPDGKELWNIKTTDLNKWDGALRGRQPEDMTGNNPHNKPPVIGSDGTVYVIAADDCIGSENFRVMALRDGKEAWSHRLDWGGEKGPEIKVQGDQLFVSRKITREFKEKGKGFFGRTKTVSKYVDRLECIRNDGTVKYTAVMNDPAEDSWSDPSEAMPFGTGPDGSACKLKDHKTAQALSPDGAPLWTFTLHHNDPKAGQDLAWLTGAPVFDRDGNVYLLGLQRQSFSTTDRDTRVIKLDGQGKLQYDCTIPGVGPKSIDPVVTDNGELIAVTREDHEGPEHIVLISPEGIVRNDVQVPPMPRHDRYGEPQNTSNGMIQNIMPGADGEVLVESATLGLGAGGQERAVLALPCFSRVLLETAIRQADEQTARGAEVEITEKEIIIDDMKMPRHQGE